MKRSTIYWPEEFNKHSSLLILTGTKDEIVTSEQSVNLANILKK